jgi:hypothetical protein
MSLSLSRMLRHSRLPACLSEPEPLINGAWETGCNGKLSGQTCTFSCKQDANASMFWGASDGSGPTLTATCVGGAWTTPAATCVRGEQHRGFHGMLRGSLHALVGAQPLKVLTQHARAGRCRLPLLNAAVCPTAPPAPPAGATWGSAANQNCVGTIPFSAVCNGTCAS